MAEDSNRTNPESRSNEQKMHRASFFQGRLRRLSAKKAVFSAAFGLLFVWLLLSGLPGPAQGPEHPNLTDAEKTWLESNPQKLLLYFNTEFPPIEFISESGEFIGLGADVLAEIEKLLGVSFRAIPSNNWNTHLAALKNGTCPIAPTIVRTEEREEFAFFTQPYATVPVVVITAETASDVVSLNNYKGKKVGVVSGYATEHYLRDQSLVGLFEVVPVSNVARGLQMVSFGEIDAFAENLAVAAYYIEKLGIPNLRVADTTDYSFAFSIGVSREYPLLYSAIEKALALIPEKDLLQIRRKWIMLETDFGIDPETLRLVQIAAVFAVLLAGGLAVITFFLKNRLNQKVKRIRQSEIRAKRQRSAIVSLALDKDIADGDPDRALNRMAKTLGRTLNVARAGIWVLSEDGGEMQCQAL